VLHCPRGEAVQTRASPSGVAKATTLFVCRLASAQSTAMPAAARRAKAHLSVAIALRAVGHACGSIAPCRATSLCPPSRSAQSMAMPAAAWRAAHEPSMVFASHRFNCACCSME